MNNLKKIPLRRCLGCFESKPKNELCRIVKNKDGQISIDKTGKMQGRGAYICCDKVCLEKAIKERRIEKEFEIKISDEIYDLLRSDINSD